MSTIQFRDNFRALYQNTSLRFLVMFAGVVIAPVLILVSNVGDASTQNLTTLFWLLLILGGLLVAALTFGWALFKQRTPSLSIASPADPKRVASDSVI
jgi:uncharacterized membrane protein